MTHNQMQVEPSPTHTVEDGTVTCRRCQLENARGSDRCVRCGSLLAGNKAALSHGLRSAGLPVSLQHLRDEVAEFEHAALIDEGDGDAVTARKRSLIGYRARLHRRIVQLDDALELKGLLDGRGRLRASWLQQLQSLVTAAKAIDAMLGLERKQRRVPTLEEIIREHQETK